MINKVTGILSVCLSVIAISGITSCKKQETIKVSYMAVNASAGAPKLDFYAMGELKEGGLRSDSNNTSKYYEVAVEGGKSFIASLKDSTGKELVSVNNPVGQDGKSYSLWAIDTGSKVQKLLLTDDLTAPESGKAKLRFVHTGADAPQVDVFINGVEVFENRFFIGYEIQSGARDFKTITANANSAISLKLPSGTTVPVGTFDLSADKIYTAYIKGLIADSTFEFKVFENKK